VEEKVLKFIDTHVRVEESQPVVPAKECLGAVLFGDGAKEQRQLLETSTATGLWRQAEVLERIVGESHARYPSRTAAVIDLQLGTRLIEALVKPGEWWPLCYPLRNTSRLLRLNLPKGSKVVARVKQVIRRHPDTFFLLDPFVHGQKDGWQSHVRLAERPNVWLTTLGLRPAKRSRWGRREAREALHFLVGEVGAAKLLYASGADCFSLVEDGELRFREWLAGMSLFESRETELVLYENAWRLLIADERL
jgi:hypothetical protein